MCVCVYTKVRVPALMSHAIKESQQSLDTPMDIISIASELLEHSVAFQQSVHTC